MIKVNDINVPQLRFKEFDGKWNEKKYGQIFSFFSTNSFSRDKLNYEKGNVRNIHYGDIHTKFETMFHLLNEEVPFINEDVDISRIKEECYCQEGDLVIADASEDYSDIGKTIELINLNNEKVLAGLHTFLARPNKQDVAKGFSGYLVQSWKVRKQVMTIAQGTKVLGLATSRLGKIKINLPSLPEQQKIAQFLTAVDSKLLQLTQKKELLAQYKKGVMQQLFSQQLRFKQDDGSDYPHWEEKRLGEIADRISTKNTSNEVNFVLTNSATQGVVSQQEYFDKEIANQNNLEGYYIVSKDDFVYNPRISASAPVGPIKRNKLQKGVMSPLYSIFRFKESLLEYFEHYFETTNWHKYLHSVANFGARHDRMNITNSDFFKMPIPMPTYDERKKIANYLSAIDTKIETVTQQIEATQQFKKGLLQQMFV